MKQFAAGIFVLLIALLVYGAAVEPRFLLDVQEVDAPLPDLPPAWEGRQVALLADLQVGMWWDNTGMIEKAVDAAVDAQPALVLLAGDFVYKPDSARVREAVALVRPLAEAGLPTYAVLGNHDYSLMKRESESRPELARYLSDQLEEAGITVLENEAVAIDPAGETPLYVVGIGSEWAENSRPAAALDAVPDGAARIVLMHNPVAYREFPPHSAPLTLTAHTHGGQIRLPVLPTESWLDIAREREVVADGWAADSIGAAGNHAYVNRGLGFSLVPIRLFCRPELTLLTLRAAPAEAAEEMKTPA